MDALVHLRKKRGAGGSNRRRASPRDAALGRALCWRCRGRLAITRAGEEDDGGDRGRVRGVWPHRIGGRDWDHVFTREGDAGVHRHIQRTSNGPVYNQTNEFVYLGENVNHNADLSTEVNRRIRNAWGAASGSTPPNWTTDRGLPSSSKSGC